MANKKNKKKTKSAGYQAPAAKAKKPTPVNATSGSKGEATRKASAAPKQSADAPKKSPKKSGAGYTAPKAKATASRAEATGGGTKMSASRQWALFGGVGVLLIGGLLFFSFRDAISGGGSGVTEAAAWDLPAYFDSDPDGRVSLAEFEGTPTVVNFWAGWCTTCDDELPDFTELADRLEGKVDFVFVHSNESDRGGDMAARHDLENYQVADDIKGTRRNGLYRDLGGGTSMPGTAFYDAEGNMVQFTATAFNLGSLQSTLLANGLVTQEDLSA